MGQMGFFTDTTLCIGCKACEVACKQGNQLPADGYKMTGNSYDNTRHLSATTWRHVAFVEQARPADGTGKSVNWLMMSDVCKHCKHPGCMEACPTDSITFGDIDELRERARRRVETLHERGETSAYLYGVDEDTSVGDLNAFFLLMDRPSVYNLPEKPKLPQENVLPGFMASFAAAAFLTAVTAFSFWSRKK